MDFDAHITLYVDNLIEHRTYIRNVGSMFNTKRLANNFAKEKGYTGIGQWVIHRTEYAPGSGRYGSWESDACREFINEYGEKAVVKILRA